MQLPSIIRTKNGRVRATVRTTAEALRLIDQELPKELRSLSRWTFARDLLEVAVRSGKKRDMNAAVRQLTQALSNEGWLAESRAGAPIGQQRVGARGSVTDGPGARQER